MNPPNTSQPFPKEAPKDRPWRIVFMGTPDFAVPTLQALIEGPHDVVGVYTQPDKPQGRGRKVQPPPVKRLALEAGLPVFQPDRMTSKPAIERFREDRPDLAVVVAYGKILRQRILDVPPLGCINCHASILPQYRGANPIFWAVANGEQSSGVDTMWMDAGMDTGPRLVRKTLEIGPNETVGEVHDRLSVLSAQALVATLDALALGTLSLTEQDHSQATHAPMLEKSQFWVDFARPAQEVHNWIRAMDPAPGIRTLAPDETTVKLFGAQGILDQEGQPGEVLHADNDGLILACGQGAVRVKQIQFAGKKRIDIKQYLAGNEFPEGYAFHGPQPSNSQESKA